MIDNTKDIKDFAPENKVLEQFQYIISKLMSEAKQNPKLTLKQFLEELEIE